MEDLSGSSISLLNTTIKTEVIDSTEYKDNYSCSTSHSAFNLIPELKSEDTEFTSKSEVIDVSATLNSLYPLLSRDSSLQDIEHIAKLENFTNSFMGNNMKENNEVSSCIPSSSFHVNTMSIPSIPQEEQEEGLHGLGIYAYDQTQFENEIMGQVDKAIKEEEEKRRKKDVERELKAVVDDIRCVKQRLSHIDKALSMAPDNQDLMTKEAKREVNAIKKEQENKMKQLKKLDAKHRTLKACIIGDVETLEKTLNENSEGNDDMDEETEFHLKQIFASKETQEEQMIRTGQMTPFGTVLAQQGQNQNNVKRHTIHLPQNELTDFEKYLLKEAESHQSKKAAKPHISKTTALNIKSKSKTSGETFPKHTTETTVNKDSPANNTTLISPLLPKHHKKSKQKIKLGSKFATGMRIKRNASQSLIENYRSDEEISDYENEIIDTDDCISEKDDEYIPVESFSEGGESDHSTKKKKKFQKKNPGYQMPKKQKGYESDDSSDSDSKSQKSPRKKYKKVIDDGCQKSYIKRLKLYEKEKLRKRHQRILESEDGIIDSDSESCTEFEGGFRVPNAIWNRLYRYQQTGVRWLWELHQQNCGGIIGDEMGLGKTIQVIAFLVGLKSSNLLTDGDHFQGLGPVILVCPTTVMHQWVKEFHSWWPPFRVAVLHESGSHTGSKESLVRTVNKYHGVLVTSYVGVVIHQKYLLDHDWHYVVLDEGHKIRNPDAQATLVVKQFRTPHRIILSGSPIQNNLKELWSLFDFVFPGKLGTLPVFMQQFSVPICQGGYANASQVQVQTAYKCATVLRNTIKPYLLRRMKDDVKMNIQLPNKSEQVLFCQLTEEQRQLYKDYIESPEIASIINGSLQIFVGLINLRKICNHPDIYSGGPKIFKDTDVSTLSEDMHYGYYKRSGKMIVVEALLRLWHKQGHRVLLFTQSRQMMSILEHFVESRNYTYMKMDGSTPISSRQPAIAKFNSDATIFVFLLTTRVGGIGVNLTGANRVILYDPDWNPSTDAQARERAWRIGQDKQVTIYRLLTSGTIEEKIYHRQIFKQFVTNRVLKDPRQRRFFKSNDLYELFTLGDMGTQGTETSAIFAGTGSEIKPVKQTKDNKRKNKSQKNKKGFWTSPPKNQINESSFSEEKMEKMRNLAKRLSLELTKKNLSNSNVNNSELNVKTANKPLDINGTSDINNTPVLPAKATQDVIDKKESVEHFSDTKKTLESKPKTPVKRKPSVKQHKCKKSRTVDIEGEKIEYLVKKDVFKTSQENDDLQSKQDDYVLSKLFKSSGVHTALKHDVIVDSSNPDYMLVEGEANRVAHDAVKALKKSRRQCSRAESGIPTWTGSNGGSGGLPIIKQRFGQKKKAPVTEEVNSTLSTPPLPPSATTTTTTTTTDDSQPGPSGISPKKFGTFNKKKIVNEDSSTPSAILSSSDLLAAIKERNKSFVTKESSTSSDEEQHSVTATKEPATEYDELLVEIRNFVAFQASVDGQATTKEILDQFRDKLAQHQTAVFKSLISKICNFYRRTTGEGVWQLKPEFQ